MNPLRRLVSSRGRVTKLRYYLAVGFWLYKHRNESTSQDLRGAVGEHGVRSSHESTPVEPESAKLDSADSKSGESPNLTSVTMSDNASIVEPDSDKDQGDDMNPLLPPLDPE